MIIDEVTLIGYKRFTVHAVNGITIRPSKQMQLIIGTNGSGKSSFMAELSPLPANPAFYTTQGKKEFKCRDHGNVYVLTSSFNPKPHHSFLKNGEELNDGGTITVQKELVKREFGLTQDLHDLLTGEINFTSMSPQDRRYWITRISKTSYDYALKVYNRFKSSARDQKGVVKHLAGRVSQETQRLQQLGNIDGLEERVKEINEELRILLAHRKEGVVKNVFDPTPLMRSLESDIQYCRGLVTYVPMGKEYKCLRDVTDDVERLQRQIEHHRELVNQYSRDYTGVEDTVNKLLKFQRDDSPSMSLEEAEAQLMGRIDETRAQLGLFTELTEANETHKDLQRVLTSLVQLFQQLPDNSQGTYSKANLEALKTRIGDRRTQLDSSRRRLAQMDTRMELINTAKDVTCPNCQYIWRPGFSEQEFENLYEQSGHLRTHVEHEEHSLEEDLHQLETMESVGQLYRQLRTMIQAYPRLAPMWDRIMSERLHLFQPASAIQMFYQFDADLRTQVHLDELLADAKELKALREGHATQGEAAYFHAHMQDLAGRIETHTLHVNELQSELTTVVAYRDKVQRLYQGLDGIEEKIKILKQRSSEEIERLRNEHIDQAMRQRHTKLGMYQSTLNDKQAISAVLDDLSESYRQAELYAQVDKILTRAMSPSEGIIADELMSMIRAMTDRMNAVMDQVWSYDLKIQPCNIEEGELDYKFPVYSAKTDVTSADVSKGSKSQKKMIDLAFRWIVMFFLELTEYPYYLDEQEEGMDDQHRLNLIGLIKMVTEHHPSSQLFMVSHYFSTYGSLTDTQTCVLDDANVGIPDNANEHVTFM